MVPPAPRQLKDVPLFDGFADRHWATDYDGTYDDVFARPYQGLTRTKGGRLIVYTNADVAALRNHPAVSHLDLTGFETAYPADLQVDGILRFFAPSTFVKQGSEHRPGKQLVSHVLSPRGVASLREGLGATVSVILDEALQRGDVDFKADVADRIVAGFWQEAIGLAPEQSFTLLKLSSQILSALRASTTRDQIKAGNRAADLFNDTLLAHMRSVDAADYPFLGHLIDRFQAMESEFLPEDPRILLAGSMLDGFFTLTSALTIVADTLLAQGIQPRDHQGVPHFPADALMESLRLHTPVGLIPRQAIDDFEYQGVHIPRGTKLLMMWMLANRDPRIFDAPNEFRLDRGERTSQFSFGGGPYICSGRNVVRVVGETMLAEMVRKGLTMTRAGNAVVMMERTGCEFSQLPVHLAGA